MDHVTVSISRGLTERLAGIKKTVDEEEKRRKSVSKADKEVLALLKEKEEIREALLRSRRIGRLLLKREEEELAKIDTQVKELVQFPNLQHSGGDYCKDQREAVEKCCMEHSEAVLNCEALSRLMQTVRINPS